MEKLPIAPVGNAYLKSFIERGILTSLKKQSNTMFFLPLMGRNSILMYIIVYKNLIAKSLNLPDLNKTIILLVNTYDESLIKQSWLRYLKFQKFNKEDIELLKTYEISDILDYLTNDKGYRVLVSIWVYKDEDGKDLFKTLYNLNHLSMNIDFNFCFGFEEKPENFKYYLGELAQFSMQNIWYLPLYDEEDIEVVINTQVEQGFVEINEKQKKDIVELSGGYAPIARYFLRNLEDISLDAWQKSELNQAFLKILDAVGEDTAELLFDKKLLVSNYKEYPYISKIKLFKDKEFFSPLFSEFINNVKEKRPSAFVLSNGVVKLNGVSVESLLSDNEYPVFKEFYDNSGEVITRDRIAELLWGIDWENKYSDWAIDQVISRIRKKIGDRGSLKLIKTIRGKGFVFNNANG